MSRSPEPAHRIRTIFKSDLLEVIDYRCPGVEPSQEEWSGEAEIVLPRAGAYQRKDRSGTWIADVNYILFLNRNQPYQIRHPFPGGDSSTVYLLQPALLAELTNQVDPARLFLRSRLVLDSRLRRLQYGLLQAASLPTLGGLLELEETLICALAEVLGMLAAAQGVSPTRPVEAQQNQADVVEQVELFLNEHLAADLRLSQVAAAVHVSPYNLCRVFKRQTGASIHQYLTYLRLHTAAERLADQPAIQLASLALELGFSSHSHFTTAFRQVFGCHPSAFRQTAGWPS